MKYFMARLYERNGEYEYHHDFLMRLTPRQKPEARLNAIAKDWYGSKPDKGDGGYYFNGGEVHVSCGGHAEITEATYNEISYVLNTLN